MADCVAGLVTHVVLQTRCKACGRNKHDHVAGRAVCVSTHMFLVLRLWDALVAATLRPALVHDANVVPWHVDLDLPAVVDIFSVCLVSSLQP